MAQRWWGTWSAKLASLSATDNGKSLPLFQDGPEVDVDLVLSEGQPVYGCLTDNWPTVEPYFNETGSNCPSILPTDQQKALIDLAVQSTQALGFTQVGSACLALPST